MIFPNWSNKEAFKNMRNLSVLHNVVCTTHLHIIFLNFWSEEKGNTKCSGLHLFLQSFKVFFPTFIYFIIKIRNNFILEEKRTIIFIGDSKSLNISFIFQFNVSVPLRIHIHYTKKI